MVLRTYAKLTKLIHRDDCPLIQRNCSVVDLHYDYDGLTGTLSLDNRLYHSDNQYLQFLALRGLQPSDIDEPTHRPESMYVPTFVQDDQIGVDSQRFLQGGQQALADAEWFDPNIDVDDDSDGDSGPNGGSGDPDGGGQVETGVVDEIEQEIADEIDVIKT